MPVLPPFVIPPVPITRRRVLGLLAGAAAAVGVPSIWISSMKTYDGPVSDHFDGMRFFDPDGVPPKIAWPRCCAGSSAPAGSAQNWPDWVPSRTADTPPPRVGGDKVRLSFVGHASWLIQTAGLNILVDPVWSMRASPFAFAGPKRRQRSRHRVRRAADDRRRAGLARPLRSSRRRDAVETRREILAARDHAARQRRHHARRRRRDQRRGVRLARARRTRQRRRRDAGADAALVGARTVRPQQGAVGELRAGDAGGQASTSSAIPATATASISARAPKRTGRCGWRSCRSAPTSRAGSCATST